MKNFVEELRWRGMLQDIMPGTEELLLKEIVTAYIGFDPTADSLHVGSLVQIMFLKHFQNCGHKPIALLGGATGMIGDPSGKSEERKLQTEEQLKINEAGIKKQLEKFLNFSAKENPAEMVNNYDWFKGINSIFFLREAGKFLTINYLLSKGFIKDRMARDQEISFTEFNYILMQAYDFMWLYQNKNCKLQMGGSDQWGNITAGTELIRKKLRGETFAITCPLMTKSDGGKFGKTETGNIWLDRNKTSPYKFYQFWLNAADEDAKKHIRIFTVLEKEEIETLEKEHGASPHLRTLQKRLAKEVTTFVHSAEDYDFAVKASEILFGSSTADALNNFSDRDFTEVFEGVPSKTINKSFFDEGLNILDLLVEQTNFLPSRGEAKKLIQAGGISLNKKTISSIEEKIISENLISKKYLLLQKGKKNYFLVIAA